MAQMQMGPPNERKKCERANDEVNVLCAADHEDVTCPLSTLQMSSYLNLSELT